MSDFETPFDSESLFDTGHIYLTNQVRAAVPIEEIRRALARHIRGDWGIVGEGDWQDNQDGLEYERRLHSAYQSVNGVTFWIITEEDRLTTTVLLPSDFRAT